MDLGNLYHSGPRYDQQYTGYESDIPFLVQLAEEFAGIEPVLEFACGTGRITIPIAQAGHRIIGVDISPAMLQTATDKIKLLDPKPAKNVTLIEADMRTYISPHAGFHHLALVPFTAFLHLTSQTDQLAALSNFALNLHPSLGFLLVDIFNPKLKRLTDSDTTSIPFLEKQVPINNGQHILIRQTATEYFPASQNCRWTFLVNIYDAVTGNLVESYREASTVRIIFPNEWRLLLQLAGFTIIKKWGNYQYQPFVDTSPRMLFLAKRTHNPLV